MSFLCEKGNVGYEKSVGFVIKDLGLSPTSVTHFSCSHRKVSAPRFAHPSLTSLSSPSPPWEI